MNNLISIAIELYLNLSKVINDPRLNNDTRDKIKYFRDNSVTSNDLMKMMLDLDFLKQYHDNYPEAYDCIIDLASHGVI